MQTILDLFNEFFTKSIDVRFLDDNEFKDYTIIKEWFEQAFKRLESIDNSNSSEAMKCVLDIENNYKFYAHNKQDIDYQCNTIKHALLKAQEPKQYLKWEDLDFKKVSKLDHKIIKAKLNEQLYELDIYRYDGDKRVEIRAVGKSYDYNLGEGYVICIDDEFPENIQFFNDLHLERVE